MSTLSIRIDPDLERRLDLEVARLGTTRSRFVQDLLSEKLEQHSPLLLLQEARAEYGLPDPAKARKRTNKAGQVKKLVQEAVAAKQKRPPRKAGA